MNSLLQMLCVKAFKKRISLPEIYFSLTEDSMLFTYCIDGRTRFIAIEERENVAEFLKDQRIITDYTGTGKNLKMIEEKMFTVAGKDGEPMFLTRITELPWEKIKFFRSDVIHFAALNEYELGGYKAGLSKLKSGLSRAKVVRMQSGQYPKAA